MKKRELLVNEMSTYIIDVDEVIKSNQEEYDEFFDDDLGEPSDFDINDFLYEVIYNYGPDIEGVTPGNDYGEIEYEISNLY
jgi:hypothetical protein